MSSPSQKQVIPHMYTTTSNLSAPTAVGVISSNSAHTSNNNINSILTHNSANNNNNTTTANSTPSVSTSSSGAALQLFSYDDIQSKSAEQLVAILVKEADGSKNLCQTVRVDPRAAELIGEKLRPIFPSVIRTSGCFIAEALFDALLPHRRQRVVELIARLNEDTQLLTDLCYDSKAVTRRFLEKVVSLFDPNFLSNVCVARFENMAYHEAACHIAQHCIANVTNDEYRRQMLDVIGKNVYAFSIHAIANYILSKVLKCLPPAVTVPLVANGLKGKILQISSNKFASNVAQMLVQVADDKTLHELVEEFFGNPEPLLHEIAEDRFGNFVVQTFINHANVDDLRFIEKRMSTVWPKMRYGMKMKSMITNAKAIKEKETNSLFARMHNNNVSAASSGGLHNATGSVNSSCGVNNNNSTQKKNTTTVDVLDAVNDDDADDDDNNELNDDIVVMTNPSAMNTMMMMSHNNNNNTNNSHNSKNSANTTSTRLSVIDDDEVEFGGGSGTKNSRSSNNNNNNSAKKSTVFATGGFGMEEAEAMSTKTSTGFKTIEEIDPTGLVTTINPALLTPAMTQPHHKTNASATSSLVEMTTTTTQALPASHVTHPHHMNHHHQHHSGSGPLPGTVFITPTGQQLQMMPDGTASFVNSHLGPSGSGVGVGGGVPLNLLPPGATILPSPPSMQHGPGIGGGGAGGASAVVTQQKTTQIRHSSNLLVAGLLPDMREDDLKQLFSRFGNILSTVVKIDLMTGKSRGFGFVRFEDRADAEKAQRDMNHARVGNNLLNVELSKHDGHIPEHNAIFVRMWPDVVSEERSAEFFNQFGPVIHTHRSHDRENEDTIRQRGYRATNITISYATVPEARAAVTALQGSFVEVSQQDGSAKSIPAPAVRSSEPPPGFGEYIFPIVVKFAEPAPIRRQKVIGGETTTTTTTVVNPDGTPVVTTTQQTGTTNIVAAAAAAAAHQQHQNSSGPRPITATIIVAGLLQEMRDNELRALFQRFGSIHSVRVKLDKKSNKSRGFGFVRFATPEEAVAAVEEMNQSRCGPNILNVELSKTEPYSNAPNNHNEKRGGGGGGASTADSGNSLNLHGGKADHFGGPNSHFVPANASHLVSTGGNNTTTTTTTTNYAPGAFPPAAPSLNSNNTVANSNSSMTTVVYGDGSSTVYGNAGFPMQMQHHQQQHIAPAHQGLMHPYQQQQQQQGGGFNNNNKNNKRQYNNNNNNGGNNATTTTMNIQYAPGFGPQNMIPQQQHHFQAPMQHHQFATFPPQNATFVSSPHHHHHHHHQMFMSHHHQVHHQHHHQFFQQQQPQMNQQQQQQPMLLTLTNGQVVQVANGNMFPNGVAYGAPTFLPMQQQHQHHHHHHHHHHQFQSPNPQPPSY